MTPKSSVYGDRVDEKRNSKDPQISLSSSEEQCTGNATEIHKEAAIQHLSIYWDTNIVKNTDPHWMDACILSTEKLETISEKISAESKYYEGRFCISSNQHVHDHHYLLNPTSISLKLSFKDPCKKFLRHPDSSSVSRYSRNSMINNSQDSQKNGSSKIPGGEGCNEIFLDVSLCCICINRSMLSDFTSFWGYIKHYQVTVQKAEQSVKSMKDLSYKENRDCLPFQFLEYWYKPRVTKQISSLAKRKKRWLWIRSVVLLHRIISGLPLGSSKFPNYRCWYQLALLVRAQQTYAHSYLLSQLMEKRAQECKICSKEAANEDVSDIENSLGLTLEEIAHWRLYALSVIAEVEQPEEKSPIRSSLFSRQMTIDRLLKFAQGYASTVAETSTDKEPTCPSLSLNRILSAVLEEEQLASSLGVVNSENSTAIQFLQSSGELEPLSWKIALKLSSLQIQLHDSMALTQLTSQSRKITHIPIFKFGCGSQIDFSSHFNGGWDMNLLLLELEVIDLTSAPLGVGNGVHPFLFGFSKRHPLTTFVDNVHGGIHLKILRKHKLGLDKSAVLSIVARVSPLEFHYRTSALERLSRMFSSLASQSSTQSHALYKATLALQQFTSRQTERIKKALIKDGSVMRGDSSFLPCDKESKIKFMFDIELISPTLKYSERLSSTARCQADSEMKECSITLNLERLHICNSDRSDHIPEGIIPISYLTWSMHIAAFSISSCGVSVLSPFSADAVFSHLHALSSPPQHFVAIDLPPISLHVSKSFKMLLSRIGTDWSNSSRYWTNQELTQKRVEQQKTSRLALRQISEDCEAEDIYLSPSPSPNRFAKSPFRKGADEESAESPPDILLKSSMKGERKIALHVSCVAAKVSLTLVNDVDYVHTQASLKAVPVIQVILYAPKITVDCCRLKQFNLICVLDDISIEDTFSGWHNSIFSVKTTLQLPNPLLISSLELDERIQATPAPFLSIEYIASSPEVSLYVSFAKTAFINWSPETIAAIHLALKTLGHQIGGVEGSFEMSVDDYDNAGEEDDEFYDANEILEEALLFYPNTMSSAQDSTTITPFFQRGFRDKTGDQHSLEGNSADDACPKQNGLSIRMKFHELFINFFKPSNEFVPQMSKLFCASANYMLIRYSLSRSNVMQISCDISEFVLRDGCNATSFDPPYSRCSKNKHSASNVTGPQYCSLYDEILDTRVPNQEVQGKQRIFSFSYESSPRTITGVGVHTEENDKTKSYTITGQDSSISIQLPQFTKIIYFQQLWMEVFDYFFEAIIGSEVILGKRREQPPDPNTTLKQENEQPSKSIPPNDVSFSNMRIDAENVIVLFPVSHCSPEYIKLSASFTASNHYDGKTCEAESCGDLQWLQWFNNLKLSLSNVSMFNWNGEPISRNSLSNQDENICFEGHVRWPIGATAPLSK